MKSLSVLAIFFTFLSLDAHGKSHDKFLRMAYFHLPPHMIVTKDSSKPKGTLVRYFEKYIAPSMNMKMKWVGNYDSFLRLHLDAKKGLFDIAPIMSKYPDAEKLFYYPTKPFYTGRHCLAVRKSNPIKKVDSSKDLRNFKIAHFNVDKSFYLPILKDKKIKIQTVTGRDWFERSVKMLKYNRVDAVYGAEVAPFLYEFHEQKMSHLVKIINLPLDDNHMYTIFNKNISNQKELLNKYNQTILKVKVSYIEYLKIYFNKFNLKFLGDKYTYHRPKF